MRLQTSHILVRLLTLLSSTPQISAAPTTSLPPPPSSSSFLTRLLSHLSFTSHNTPNLEFLPPSSPRPDTARYNDDLVLRFNVTSPSSSAASLTSAINTLYIDLWSATKSHIDIRVSKQTLPLLLRLLPEEMRKDGAYQPLMSSLADTVAETYPDESEQSLQSIEDLMGRVSSPGVGKASRGAHGDVLFFKEYQPWEVIVRWMGLLESLFPGHVKMEKVGKTYEGREILGLRIGAGVGTKRDDEDGTKKKPVIVVTGGMHAREWISVSTVNYVAYTLATGYIPDAPRDVREMVEKFEWVFIPTLNVDGYIHTHTTDRLWKKSRQSTSLPFCPGIDLDRSFTYHFDTSPPSTGNPCSDMFSGTHALEAVEAKAFVDYTKSLDQEIIAFLDLHSYSQQILFPYAFSCDAEVPGLETIEELAIGLAKAVRLQSGEHYTVASACEATGIIPMEQGRRVKGKAWPGLSGGGSLLDYMHAEVKVPFAYQVKLRDTGAHGFLLPREAIAPTGDEVVGLVKAVSLFLGEEHGPTVARFWGEDVKEKVDVGEL